MGQTSSQVGPPTQPDSEMAGPSKSKSKSKKSKSKSKKSKRKSQEVEQVEDTQDRIDDEQESARALMQLKQGAFHNTTLPYYDDNAQASAQLHAESSPARPVYPSNTAEQEINPSGNSRMPGRVDGSSGHGKKQKHTRRDVFDIPSTDGTQDARAIQRYVLSTPPSQRDQTPERDEVASQAMSNIQALDEVPLDDEIHKSYMQAFPDGATSAEPTQAPQADMFGHSQNDFIAQVEESAALPMYTPYQQPTHVYTSPTANAKGKSKKKRKRLTDSGPDGMVEEQPTHQDAEGQYALDHDFDAGPFDFEDEEYHADLFDGLEDLGMPIDPELHSTHPLPPPSGLANMDDQREKLQEQIQGLATVAHSIRPQKRRRVEDGQDVQFAQEGPYYSTYPTEGHQEDDEEYIPPLVRDSQREASIELDSAFHNKTTDYNKQDQRKMSTGNGQDGMLTTQNTNRNGNFGAAELSKLEAFRISYCRANDITVHKFNDIIQSNIRSNPQAFALYNEIQELFPSRKRQYLQRYCRRRFHNFSARGTWTPDQDEELRQAVAEKGMSWKTVGEMIERFPEDCRDRWRNYLNAENRNQESWTRNEILDLSRAISDGLRKLKEDRRETLISQYGRHAATFVDDLEQEAADMKLINWQTVSDRMGDHGGGRSRLQCLSKWGKMKQEDRDRHMRELCEPGRWIEARGRGSESQRPKSTGWRMKVARRKVSNMRGGDKYDLLSAILNCGAPTEANMSWKTLGEEPFRSKWTAHDKKAAWGMIQEALPKDAPEDYRERASQLLTTVLAQDIDERWHPDEEHDDDVEDGNEQGQGTTNGNEKGKKGKRKATKKPPNTLLKEGKKSNRFVQDDDDEEEEDGAGAHQQGVPTAQMVPDAQPDHTRLDPQLTPHHKSSRRADCIGSMDEEDLDHARSPDSLFDASEAGTLSPGQGVSPDLANRVQLLQHA